MAFFTIRVELHDATRHDYTNLADNLQKIGITDIISNDDGQRFRMPPAEYNYQGTQDIHTIYTAVVGVAKYVGRTYAVFITEGARRIWIGLTPV